MATLNDRRRSDAAATAAYRESRSRSPKPAMCVRRVSQVAGCCDSRSRVHACRSPLAVRSRRRRRLRLRKASPERSQASRRRRHCCFASLFLAHATSRVCIFLFFILFYLLTSRQEKLSLSCTREKIVSRGSLEWQSDDEEATSSSPWRIANSAIPSAILRAVFVRRAARLDQKPTRIYSALWTPAWGIFISPSRGMPRILPYNPRKCAGLRRFRDLQSLAAR